METNPLSIGFLYDNWPVRFRLVLSVSTTNWTIKENNNTGFKTTMKLNYDWLVVAGARGQFKGEGTVNGQSGYGFMLTAIDGALPGGGGTDKFRMKVWVIGGEVVYDNQIGADDNSDPSTTLGGGQIIIHND